MTLSAICLVLQASQSAIEAVEQSGCSIVTRHFNRLALRALLKPHKFDGPLPFRAKPNPKWMRYYLKDENRGEFSLKVQRTILEKRKKQQESQ